MNKTICVMGTALVMVLASAFASAGAAKQPTRPQLTIVVTGSIVVAPDGSVATYTLDRPKLVPPGVASEMAKTVPRWKFKPVMRNGKAVTAKSYMSVRLLAKPVAHDNYAIRISGAQFGKFKGGYTQDPTKASGHYTRKPPKYPARLRRFRVSGAVYLLLQVNRKGQVTRAAARKVDLSRNEGMAPRLARHLLARTSLRTAGHWSFPPPTKHLLSDDGYWYVRIPVIFRLVPLRPQYGPWRPYWPGPTHYIPWANKHMVASDNVDAIPANGGVYPMQQSLQLATPLNSSDGG